MRARLLLLGLVLSLLLSACSPAQGQEGSASSSQGEDSSTQDGPEQEARGLTLAVYPAYSFHPCLSSNRSNLTIAPLLYEPLFQVDGSFSFQGVLCERWSANASQTIWTFTLRQGVTFSDGTPLTAEIVVQALNTARGEGSRYQNRLSAITSVYEQNGQVVITLARANGALPVLLDVPIALDGSDRPLGTGPYVLSQSGSSLSLTARRDWWQGEALPVQEVRLASMVQTDDILAAFGVGDVTMLDTDLTSTNALGYYGNYEVWDYATSDLIYLGFRTGWGPCADADLRLAISRGIDRSALVRSVLSLHAQASPLPFHPASSLYDQASADALGYDPGVLSALVLEKGSPQEELKLIVNRESATKVNLAQYVADQLSAAGLTVTVEQLSWEDYLSALSRGDFDLYVGEVLLGADFDLTALLSSSGSLNYGRFQNWELTALISALASAPWEERTDAAASVCAYLVRECPIAPLCFKNGSVLTQWGQVSGLSPVQNNPFYQLSNWTLS